MKAGWAFVGLCCLPMLADIISAGDFSLAIARWLQG